MDSEVDYPSAKRRRTSLSRSTSRSRSPSRTPTRSRRASAQGRGRSYSRSRSRSRSAPSRGRRTPSDSSHYVTPGGSRSRNGSPYKSRSISPAVRVGGSTSNSSSTRSLRFLPLHTLPRAHVRGITCAKFSPDGALLATASADATINIYSVPSNPSRPSFTSPTGQEPLTHSEFKHIRTLRGHVAGVNALSWSPIGTGSVSAPSTTPGAAANDPSTTPSEDSSNIKNKFYTLASASDDKTILLWSPLSSDTPISPSPLTGHSNYVSALCFSPKGNMLVSGSYDEAVWLWDVRSGRCMRQLPAHSDPVRGVDFICDGTMVCSCSTDGLIRIWDSGTGQCLRTLVDEDRKGVTGVLWAPNGRYLLAWTLDGCVRLWDYVGGRCVKTYQGHINKEFSLGGAIGMYFPNGGGSGDGGIDEEAKGHAEEVLAAFVASGSEDGDVVVWDVTTKEVLWRGEGHRDVVLSVDCTQSRDGGRGLMVSVGRDRALKMWIEDVDEHVLQQRRARLLLHQQQQHHHHHGAEVNGHVGGYALDEDEDVDAQILEMEGNHHEEEEIMEAEVNIHVNGNGIGGENGHAMEIDTAA